MSPTSCGREHGLPRLVVQEAGYATVQDLGRPGHAHEGVAANGASDRWSARVANTLVGNAPEAPLVEVTGSALTLAADADLFVCLTGADVRPTVDGRAVPVWEPFVLEAGGTLALPAPERGLRTYVAVAGGVRGDAVLGSVAPDPMLGVGRSLGRGDRLEVGACVCDWSHPHFGLPLFRLGAQRPTWSSPTTLEVTAGPELEEFSAEALRGPWTVTPSSDHVGLRVDGPTPVRSTSAEILSRGVPVGAVEAPPSGGLLLLLYGRLLTAGYPVPYVATSTSLDLLGQARPGDELLLREVDLADAVAHTTSRREDLAELARRTATAMRASGLGHLVAPGHLCDG